MEDDEPFVDYYKLLHVTPGCDDRILEAAYHHFLKKYHPDHAETADVDKFKDIVAAYKVLKDPEKRAKYDRTYAALNGGGGVGVGEIHDDEALGDAEAHELILSSLYKRRRENAKEPGLGPWLIQDRLGCTQEEFDFHVWYLRSKGLIETTEAGTLAVTVAGVDHVISTSKTTKAVKLINGRADADEA